MLQFTESYRKQGNIKIKDDQVEGINFLLTHVGGILAFGTGMGKTITSLTAMKIVLDNYKRAKCVIICPVKATKAFLKEIKKIGYDDSEVGLISTKKKSYDIISNKVLIVTDTNVGKHIDAIHGIIENGNKILMILDEAHKLQDQKSKFYQTMTEVKKLSTICWYLTATPILNGLDGLYSIVSFAYPGYLGTKTDFNNKYTIWHLKDQYVKGGKKRKVRVIDDYQNLDKLNERLKDVMIVRQIQYDLKFGNIFKEMTDEEYRIYEKVSSGILFGEEEERNFSKRLHDLQRFVDRSYDEDESIKELVKEYNSLEYSTKESMMIEAVEKTLSQGYSIIIYADYKDTIQRLHYVLTMKKKELGLNNIFEIHGSIDIKTREQVEEKIGQRDIVLISSAGTESINLQRCNCLIFYDIPFSVKTIVQAVGRVCRRDTKYKHQYIITLCTKQTVDEYKYKLFQKNLWLVQQSVGIAQDLPLSRENLKTDEDYIRKLKEDMLWHYKGSGKRKRRKQKMDLKSSIFAMTLEKAKTEIAPNKFLIEDIPCDDISISRVEVLFPDGDLYKKFVNGEIPFTVLRSKYLDFLRSDRGKKLIRGIQDGVMKKGNLILVGDTEIPNVLMQEVLDQYSV